MPPLVILAVGVLAVVLLVVRLRQNAFVALIAAAVLVGVLTPGLPLGDVMKEVAGHFGRVVGSIGIAIAMAAIVGECLMESGAADKIVRRCVGAFGEKRASLSLVAAGYVLGIPVFFDTVFYLLVPVARALSLRGGQGYVLNVLAISAGGSATHVLVPPTPGPLVMAATLHVDIGLTILVGLGVALPASIASWLYAVWIDRRLGIAIREAPGLSLAELQEVAARPESELPGFWASLLPILLPVALISSSTTLSTISKGSSLARAATFWGDPNFSLMLSAAVALFVLARHTGRGLGELSMTVETAIKSAGVIILITAGGGAFGAMLVGAGVGDVLGRLAQGLGLSPLVLGFLLASLFRVAQGSATVAMITASSIMAPIAAGGTMGFHPVYLVMAIGGGSLVGQWMNDSGFWVFRTLTGLTEVETLKTKSAMMGVLGVTALVTTWLASRVFPLL